MMGFWSTLLETLLVNERGVLMKSLQMGEFYYLIRRFLCCIQQDE